MPFNLVNRCQSLHYRAHEALNGMQTYLEENNKNIWETIRNNVNMNCHQRKVFSIFGDKTHSFAEQLVQK